VGPKRIGVMTLTFRSRGVIGHVTIRFPLGYFLFASSDSFCLGKTHRLATIHTLQTDDRQTQHCSISATVSTVG